METDDHFDSLAWYILRVHRKAPPPAAVLRSASNFPTRQKENNHSKKWHEIGNGHIDIHDNASSGCTDPHNIVCLSCRLACTGATGI